MGGWQYKFFKTYTYNLSSCNEEFQHYLLDFGIFATHILNIFNQQFNDLNRRKIEADEINRTIYMYPQSKIDFFGANVGEEYPWVVVSGAKIRFHFEHQQESHPLDGNTGNTADYSNAIPNTRPPNSGRCIFYSLIAVKIHRLFFVIHPQHLDLKLSFW